MPESEDHVKAIVRKYYGRRVDLKLFPNPTGVAYVKRADGELEQRRFGLQVPGGGAGDDLGWVSLLITPEMVGNVIAQFVSIELKKEGGKIAPEQKRWEQNVIRAGGAACIAIGVDAPSQIDAALYAARRGVKP